MKVLIDTNILISAMLKRSSIPAAAYSKAAELPYECLLCDYCIDEFSRVIRKKMPGLIKDAESFLAKALVAARVISAPSDTEAVSEEAAIRDVKDHPVVRAAVKAKADIILTGDRDFLESGIKKPMMLSPSEFLAFKK